MGLRLQERLAHNHQKFARRHAAPVFALISVKGHPESPKACHLIKESSYTVKFYLPFV